MKTAHCVLLVLLLLLAAACNAGESASNNAAKLPSAAPSNQASGSDGNTNSSKPNDASGPAKPSETAHLIGTYESREVHDQGVVTLITKLKTLWMFSADGTYQRRSEVKGSPYHADSGTFRIEQPDKLVLTIQVTGLKDQRKIQNPPLTKTHIFTLSPDGDELRLTSAKGSIGIFERIAKPKTP